ncbi:MAG: HAMP domain-containing sensor histidine kinase, partial [Cyanobacteria bacterium J06632_3]
EINNPMACIANNVEPAQEYVQGLSALIQLYQKHCPDVPEAVELIEAQDLEFALQDLPKLLESMQLSIDRIKDISSSLRNFARGDVNDRVPFDIHKGLDDTLVILGHRLKANGDHSSVKIDRQYGSLPKVTCFPSAINQVFMNILANALDTLETIELPRITLITHQPKPGWVQIEFADNGPGIDEGDRERLFEPLFTTKPVGKGTGLGLAISHDIVVKKHHGFLECISEPGKGCRFTIVLPVHSDDVDEREGPAERRFEPWNKESSTEPIPEEALPEEASRELSREPFSKPLRKPLMETSV